ncbi:MAG TPA: hypothetical protein VHK70_09865, partial [Burkholderiaceae bacterium]|nr:hypothetical protein [Burkholderiaceae bacterium]
NALGQMMADEAVDAEDEDLFHVRYPSWVSPFQVNQGIPNAHVLLLPNGSGFVAMRWMARPEAAVIR